MPADLQFPVVFHGTNYIVHVKLRPGLKKFLEAVSKIFEVVVFTASQKVYADALLNLLDPGTSNFVSFTSESHMAQQSPKDGQYIHHRLFRESCIQVEGNFLKDLSVVNRPLCSTILVDNSPHAFGYQLDNGIPIESWFDDPKDKELKKLLKFLRQIVQDNDVRPAIRSKFESHSLVDGACD